MDNQLRKAEFIVNDLTTPVLYGGNDIIEDYTKKIIILEKWHDMMVEMYYEPSGCVYCDFEEVYKKAKLEIEDNLRRNIRDWLKLEVI